MSFAETITVGSELVRGQSVDTHSAYLGGELLRAGHPVRFQVSVGDSADDIAAALKQALARTQLIVITGGLGPTLDDLSREATAAALGLPLVEDPAVWQAIQDRFKAAGRAPSPNNRRQAQVPQGATVLPNPNGTAPGLRLDLEGGKSLFLLPGPPSELKPMVRDQVLPWLQARRGGHQVVHRLLSYGIGESGEEAQSRGDYVGNVKRWRSGNMVVRWVGAGIREASRSFRKLRGYQEIPRLLAALKTLVKQGELDTEKKVA